MDDEAPRDPRVTDSYRSITQNDIEGHRVHTFYIGLHVQGCSRKEHQRKHKHHRHHKSKGFAASESCEESMGVEESASPCSEHLQLMLGLNECVGIEPHPIFTELEELISDGDTLEWRETARWIKYEEDVEEGGNRWSKPHVATVSLHSLFELRSHILNGTILLDMDACTLEQVSDLMLDTMTSSGQLKEDLKVNVKHILMCKHRHQYEKRHDWRDKNSQSSFIRSLGDIGRGHSKISSYYHTVETGGSPPVTPLTCTSGNGKPFFTKFFSSYVLGNLPSNGSSSSNEEIPKDSNSFSLSNNSKQPTNKSNDTSGHTSSSSPDLLRLNHNFMRKIAPNTEACNVLVGEVDFLENAIVGFVRLNQACSFGDLTEVPIPTRFIFVILGPIGNKMKYHQIGRAMASVMSSEYFHNVVYKARNRSDLLIGVDEFLDAVIVLPPGNWDPDVRIEPPQQPSKVFSKSNDQGDNEENKWKENGLQRTGRIFGGLINDVKRKVPWYPSDFKDAFSLQSVASVIFLYVACLAPIITFGGLLGNVTQQRMAAMESLISGALCGIIYGLFSGQPLTLLGSTGPVLVFEGIVYDLCGWLGLEYLSVRVWIGIWTATLLFLLSAFDASVFVCYITRFTEENFSFLISAIFIYEAFQNIFYIVKKFPFQTGNDVVTAPFCQCVQVVFHDSQSPISVTSLTAEDCQMLNGTVVPDGCTFTPSEYVPDVFLLSIILFAGTFFIIMLLRNVKNTPFFIAKIRAIISDFSVIIAIVIMSSLDAYLGLDTPKLDVPQNFKPTWSGRTWLIPFFGGNPWWTVVGAVIPSVFATILIFMDQQITSVIVNRKENKLKKGCGYHLDLFVLALLILLCSIFGLPWFVAATVLAITHVNSLKMDSQCSAPGEKPQFLGVREQRVTHISIFILVGLSIFFTSVLKFIPMPVLYGVFLYMGVSSLKGTQFFDRILIIFMPQKYQPDYTFLRQVPIRQVHLFTAIQLLCFVILWVFKYFKQISICFPLLLLAMILVRKCLGYIFLNNHLKMLDDDMPESAKKKDKQPEKGTDDKLTSNVNDFSDVSITMSNGNVMKVPVKKIDERNEDCHIAISELLMQSSVWKSIDQQSHKTYNQKNISLPSPKKRKKRCSAKDALNAEERRRLSTMNEEEECLTEVCTQVLLSPTSDFTCIKVKGDKTSETSV